jgi:hypothetical protein
VPVSDDKLILWYLLFRIFDLIFKARVIRNDSNKSKLISEGLRKLDDE